MFVMNFSTCDDWQARRVRPYKNLLSCSTSPVIQQSATTANSDFVDDKCCHDKSKTTASTVCNFFAFCHRYVIFHILNLLKIMRNIYYIYIICIYTYIIYNLLIINDNLYCLYINIFIVTLLFFQFFYVKQAVNNMCECLFLNIYLYIFMKVL